MRLGDGHDCTKETSHGVTDPPEQSSFKPKGVFVRSSAQPGKGGKRPDT